MNTMFINRETGKEISTEDNEVYEKNFELYKELTIPSSDKYSESTSLICQFDYDFLISEEFFKRTREIIDKMHISFSSKVEYDLSVILMTETIYYLKLINLFNKRISKIAHIFFARNDAINIKKWDYPLKDYIKSIKIKYYKTFIFGVEKDKSIIPKVITVNYLNNEKIYDIIARFLTQNYVSDMRYSLHSKCETMDFLKEVVAGYEYDVLLELGISYKNKFITHVVKDDIMYKSGDDLTKTNYKNAAIESINFYTMHLRQLKNISIQKIYNKTIEYMNKEINEDGNWKLYFKNIDYLVGSYIIDLDFVTYDENNIDHITAEIPITKQDRTFDKTCEEIQLHIRDFNKLMIGRVLGSMRWKGSKLPKKSLKISKITLNKQYILEYRFDIEKVNA